MALSSYVGSFSTPLVTGNQAITGLGFTPKLVFFFATPQTALGMSSGSGMCLGGASGTSEQFAMGKMCPHAQTPARQWGGYNNTRCIHIAGASSNLVVGALVSLDTDGFTVNFTTVDAANTYLIHFLALGGSSLSAVSTANQTIGPGVSLQNTTGHSFQPNCVLFMNPGAYTGPANADAFTNGGFGIFAASDAGTQVGGGCRFTDNVNPTQNYTRARTDQVMIATASNSNDSFFTGYFCNWTSVGFNLRWTVVPSGLRYFSRVSLQADAARSGFFQQPTSTGNQSITGLGFAPEALLIWGLGKAANTSLQNHSSLQVGITDGVNQRGIFNAERHGVATSSNYQSTYNSLIQQRSDQDGSLQAEASLVSLDADGFTLSWSTVDATPRQFYYLALGESTPSLPARRRGGFLG